MFNNTTICIFGAKSRKKTLIVCFLAKNKEEGQYRYIVKPALYSIKVYLIMQNGSARI